MRHVLTRTMKTTISLEVQGIPDKASRELDTEFLRCRGELSEYLALWCRYSKGHSSTLTVSLSLETGLPRETVVMSYRADRDDRYHIQNNTLSQAFYSLGEFLTTAVTVVQKGAISLAMVLRRIDHEHDMSQLVDLGLLDHTMRPQSK